MMFWVLTLLPLIILFYVRVTKETLPYKNYMVATLISSVDEMPVFAAYTS